MKLLWIVLILLCFGCEQNNDSIKAEKEKTTIRETYYLRTVLHDEHLFIISKYGHFIHHMDCPCFTTKSEEKLEPPKIELPKGNILDLLKGNRP